MAKSKKLRPDINEIAFGVAQAAIGEGDKPQPPGSGEKNPEAVRRGSKGGKKGGKARRDSLTPAKRKTIARRASGARWRKGD